MKKLALAVAVTGALGATTANALVLSESGNGVLVPLVTYIDDATMGTAIDLTSCAEGYVYWTFFDVDSEKILDSQFHMTPNDKYAFIWADESGLGLSDAIGYMTFMLDTSAEGDPGWGWIDVSDLPCLAGNAFQVNLPHLDVAFQPVLPIQAALGDLGPESGGFYATVPLTGPNDLAGLSAGANAHDVLYMRYAVDNIPTDDAHNTLDTTIWLWSASDIHGTHGLANEVNIYDHDQDRRSIRLDLPNDELNWIDPEPILGRPAHFVDGFIRWDIPHEFNNEYVTGIVSWSVVSSTVFGAEQTIINPIHLFDHDGNWVYRARFTADHVVPSLLQSMPYVPECDFGACLP